MKVLITIIGAAAVGIFALCILESRAIVEYEKMHEDDGK